MVTKQVRRTAAIGTATLTGTVDLVKEYLPSETNCTCRIICTIRGSVTGDVGVLVSTFAFSNHSGSVSSNGSGTIGSSLESTINDVTVSQTNGSDGGGVFFILRGVGTANNQNTTWTMIAETTVYTP